MVNNIYIDDSNSFNGEDIEVLVFLNKDGIAIVTGDSDFGGINSSGLTDVKEITSSSRAHAALKKMELL